MSNYRAVATVSEVLARRLHNAVNGTNGQASAVVGPPVAPGDEPSAPQARVFLYNVQPNGAWRNSDLPTRSSGGREINRPQAALDLHYLLTFQGGQSALEPQLLLGAAVNELHANPVVSREEIQNVITDTALAPLLGASDLDEQPELVRFTPLLLDLEALSKLWSVLFQIPYRLSVAYQASVVLISPDTMPRPVLPVSERRLLVTTFRRPRIDRVDNVDNPGGPMLVGTTLRLLGSQLRGDITNVLFGALPVIPASENVTDRKIRIAIPVNVQAGLIGVRVEHRFLIEAEDDESSEDEDRERPAGQSNVAPIILRPSITVGDVDVTGGGSAARTGTVELAVEPAVGMRQRVVAYLTMTGLDPDDERVSYSFAVDPQDAIEEPVPDPPHEQTDTLVISFSGVQAGTYLVQISVDGVESPLERDASSGRYIAPQVEIP
jgi:hypothetical protein